MLSKVEASISLCYSAGIEFTSNTLFYRLKTSKTWGLFLSNVSNSCLSLIKFFSMNFPLDSSEQLFVVNQQIKPISEFDLTYLDGAPIIYEVIKIVNSTPLFFEEHMERLANSISDSGLPNFSMETVKQSVVRLLTHNPVKLKNIRIALVYGEKQSNPTLLVYFIHSKYPSMQELENGVPVITVDAERANPNIKSENAPLRSMANEHLATEGCYEVLLVNRSGNITEGSRSNVFFVNEEKLVTAPLCGVLGGVTRKKVMDVCQSLHIPLEEKYVSLGNISNFTSCFITGTSPGVLPISSINGTSFNPKHSVMQKIMVGYEKMTELSLQQWSQKR